MRRTVKKFAIWAGVAAVALAVAVAIAVRNWPRAEGVTEVTGAVLAADVDLHEQRPVAQATVRAVSGRSTGEATTDASGFFSLRITPAVPHNQPMTLTVRHRDYQPFEAATRVGDRIQLLRLVPNAAARIEPASERPTIPIANIRVRYALKSSTTAEVGSAARTFEVVNTANVACSDRPPCSPDGKWKATVGAFSLDAGENRQFRNARVSCLAGPCPFTRIESDAFTRGGRVIGVSVRNWTDTVTYLVEAEVLQTMVSDLIRHSYPVIFGRSMNFTLPATAQGPSIEAEVDGTNIIFPLGPKLLLSWATCRLETRDEGTRLYRCELKPRYLFK